MAGSFNWQNSWCRLSSRNNVRVDFSGPQGTGKSKISTEIQWCLIKYCFWLSYCWETTTVYLGDRRHLHKCRGLCVWAGQIRGRLHRIRLHSWVRKNWSSDHRLLKLWDLLLFFRNFSSDFFFKRFWTISKFNFWISFSFWRMTARCFSSLLLL